jgi:hypothetical protein
MFTEISRDLAIRTAAADIMAFLYAQVVQHTPVTHYLELEDAIYGPF